MIIEALLVIVLLCAAIVPLLAVSGRIKASGRTTVSAIVALWLGLAILIITTMFVWTTEPANGEMAVTNRPIQVPTGDYVGSAACQICHPHNHATWHDSYHRTMTQVANEESVIGNFDNVRLAGKDLDVRLFRQDGKFLVEMTRHNPEFTRVFPVVMTTGSHTRQAYWMTSGNDSRPMMILPYMFLRAEQKWIPRHSGYITPECLQERPELAVFAANLDRWRYGCIRCHATRGRTEPIGDKTSAPNDRASETQAVEFGISCEACHGPGAEHVRVNRNPLHRYRQRLAGQADSSIVNPARLPHDRASEVCGQCHAVVTARSDEAMQQWLRHGFSYRPGDDLGADPIHFIVRGRFDLMPNRPVNCPDPATTGSFWSDGMIRASGREYNGLLDTPCFQRGKMSCLSCHQMHQSRGDPRPRPDWADDQLKFGMDGNSACLQCHERFKNVDQLTRHTHHAAGSSGSACYNCHMPFTTYGLLKAIRSHQINSPSVQGSLESGRPNACNQCHQDRTLAWTADYLSRWYDVPRPKLSADEQQIAATVLWALSGDAAQRAVTAWSFGWEDGLSASGNHWQAPYLAQLLEDRYDAVRYIAERSLRRLPGFHDFAYDFVGPPEQRAAAHQRALRIWAGAPKSPERPFAAPVLIDGQGRVQQTPFERLWKQRDDRPVTVNE
jgi:hypothetical protein